MSVASTPPGSTRVTAMSACSPRLARQRQRTQALADQPAVLVVQRHDVGHRGERDEVEVLVGEGGIEPSGAQQSARQSVGDARRAQVRARIAADARMNDRHVRERPSARGVWWSVTTTAIPRATAAATSSTAVIPQSAVTRRRVPRAARRSIVAGLSP
jgi:hypothetical protein